MDNSTTTIFSAPVVQSRLEHHHLQQQKQLLKPHKPEARHQRSKSINKGKRGHPLHNNSSSPSNQSKESSVPVVSVSASDCSNSSRLNTKSNFNNRVDNFDSLRGDSKFPDFSLSNNFNNPGTIDDSYLSTNNSIDINNKPVVRRSSERRPSRKHNHSDSNGDDKFRNGPQVTILKRPQSATDFVRSSNNNNVTPSKPFLDVTREEHDYQHPSAVGDYSKERRRSDVSPSKSSKCSQRRKDVKSTSGILQVIESCNYEQQDSNKESDVNSILLNPSMKSSYSPKIDPVCLSAPPQQTNNNSAFYFPPLNYSNAILALEEEMPSTSPDRLMASKLYAGPTFHNSPAPSDLPLPSFLSKPPSKESSPMTPNAVLPVFTPSRVPSPSLSSGNSSDDDMFTMDDVEPDAVRYSDRFYTVRKQESSELLRILSDRQYNSSSAYMVPERMATSHNPTQVYPTRDGLSLTEISE
ncbi:18669_t:CDS:2, partial [Racocetra fulgida]